MKKNILNLFFLMVSIFFVTPLRSSATEIEIKDTGIFYNENNQIKKLEKWQSESSPEEFFVIVKVKNNTQKIINNYKINLSIHYKQASFIANQDTGMTDYEVFNKTISKEWFPWIESESLIVKEIKPNETLELKSNVLKFTEYFHKNLGEKNLWPAQLQVSIKVLNSNKKIFLQITPLD